MFKITADTRFGTFTAISGKEGIVRIYLPGQKIDPIESSLPEGISSAFVHQLEEYLNGQRKDWNLPYSLTGTPFRLSCLYACLSIPYGETRSYSEIAEAVGHPGACRAVGTAMSSNPLPLIIPCHRVLPSDGSIGKYGGGSDLKRELLELESGK